MTVTDSIIKVCDWLNKEVCPSFKFKKPPDEQKGPITEKYQYEEVSPYAFPIFVPAKDKMPPRVKCNVPAACVQLLGGSDTVTSGTRDINIMIGISCWNPGVHSKDIYYPKGTAPDQPELYRSGYSGWMDAWNFADEIIRKIESTAEIDGLYLAKDIPVSFGPYKEQDTIPDLYPFWLSYVQFTLRSDFIRNNQGYSEFL